MPSPVAPDPLLGAILASAAEATQAARGWLFAVAGDQLGVVAGYGDDAATKVGARGPRQFGWAGFVLGSRQPVALSPGPDDPRFLGDLVADPAVRPASLLCFPCVYEATVRGAIQLEDKAGGAPFGLDDVELVTLLAEIAGAAIEEMAAFGAPLPPSPEELGADLGRLAAANPGRYLALSLLLDELLQRT